MTFTTSAGTTIGLSASAPATYNQAGYEALTFTTLGEVEDLGDIPSRIYELVTFQTVAARGKRKAKGGYDLGSQTITFAIDPSDSGQAMLDTAIAADTAYSVIIDHTTLGTIYARALIMGGPKKYGTVNSVAMRTLTLEYTIVDASTDGIVFVA